MAVETCRSDCSDLNFWLKLRWNQPSLRQKAWQVGELYNLHYSVLTLIQLHLWIVKQNSRTSSIPEVLICNSSIQALQSQPMQQNCACNVTALWWLFGILPGFSAPGCRHRRLPLWSLKSVNFSFLSLPGFSYSRCSLLLCCILFRGCISFVSYRCGYPIA